MDEMILQTIEMLRSYSQEPNCPCEKQMADTMFSEMLQYAKTDEQKIEMKRLFNRTR
jgi:hypothetical protein